MGNHCCIFPCCSSDAKAIMHFAHNHFVHFVQDLMDNTSALTPACGLDAIGLSPTAFGGLYARHFALASLLVLCAYIVYEQAVFLRNRCGTIFSQISGTIVVIANFVKMRIFLTQNPEISSRFECTGVLLI